MRRRSEGRDGRADVAHVGDRAVPLSIAADPAPPPPIARALATMRGPLDRPLPLETLAESAGLSPFHFARTFRQAIGIPPGQFLTALRLEQAKGLLLTTDLSVTEICFAVGYDSVGTFTTRFTQLVGLSPGRIRALPELLSEALARLPEGSLTARRPALATAPSVVGRIEGDIGGAALLFVGLFPGAIPQGRPIVGTVLTAAGSFRLAAPPDGRYHLLAAAVPHLRDARDTALALLPGAARQVARAPGLVTVRGGYGVSPAPFVLRPPLPTDPPVLVALPALLLAHCEQLRPARPTRD